MQKIKMIARSISGKKTPATFSIAGEKHKYKRNGSIKQIILLNFKPS